MQIVKRNFLDGTTGKFMSDVWYDCQRSEFNIYIKRYNVDLYPDKSQHALIFKEDQLVWEAYPVGGVVPCLIKLPDTNWSDAKVILQSLAEALADEGFIPEVDNKERITAQAVAEERKEEIGYLRSKIDYIFDKLIGRVDAGS